MSNKGTSASEITKEILWPMAVSAIAAVNPGVGVLAVGLGGVAQVARKQFEERVQEIDQNADLQKLLNTMNRSEKMRDVVLQILRRVIEESAVERRRLYYHYLRRLSQGIRPEFDYHTRVIELAQRASFEEIRTFADYKENFEEIKATAKDSSGKLAEETPQPEKSYFGMSITGIFETGKFKVSLRDFEQSLIKLGEYGLIIQLPGRMDGTLYGQVTDFGEAFWDFVAAGERRLDGKDG